MRFFPRILRKRTVISVLLNFLKNITCIVRIIAGVCIPVWNGKDKRGKVDF